MFIYFQSTQIDYVIKGVSGKHCHKLLIYLFWNIGSTAKYTKSTLTRNIKGKIIWLLKCTVSQRVIGVGWILFPPPHSTPPYELDPLLLRKLVSANSDNETFNNYRIDIQPVLQPRGNEAVVDGNPGESLSPSSLQYFISSLANTIVALGNQDSGFVRRLNDQFVPMSRNKGEDHNYVPIWEGGQLLEWFLRI